VDHSSDVLVTRSIEWIYQSYNRAKNHVTGQTDAEVRHPEWTRRLLDELGSPDKSAYNVVVTGSKGKGTHAILLAALLQRAGFRVGLFTSPHLVDFLERIRVGGVKISNEGFLASMSKVREIAERFSVPKAQYLGPVGLVAAAAALWFQRQQTEINIYELGRGARYDDVNQVQHQGAVVAPIFREHVKQLGPDLEDICENKMGVLTDTTRWCVLHEQPLETNLCLSLNHTLASFSGQFEIGGAVDVCVQPDFVDAEESLAYQIVLDKERQLTVVGPSVLQDFRGNLSVAVRALSHIWSDRRPSERLPQLLSLQGLQLPGRMQVLSTHPLILLDGAIHRENARRVCQHFGQNSASNEDGRNEDGRKRHARGAILCLPADKDGQGVVDELSAWVDWLIFCPAQNAHLVFNGEFADYARSMGMDVWESASLEDAWHCRESLGHADDAVLLLGTQSFLSECLVFFQVPSEDIWSMPRFMEGVR
jgi:dihydrofolate synthase/folylpolyglutamate synthase